jgi:hypothetical protein
VWTLEAAGTGRVELLVIPVAAGAFPLIRRAIDVDSGAPPGPPPGPPPNDPFAAAVQAAYVTENDPMKATERAVMAAAYRAGAIAAADPNAKTLSDVFLVMRAKDTVPGMLPAVRKVIGTRLNASLGTTATTPINRTLVPAELNAVAAALEAIK